MELAAQIPRMIGQLADFDIHRVRCFAGEPQAVVFQHGFVLPIELVAMPVTLADLRFPVRFTREAVSASRQGYAPSRIVPPNSSTL